MHDAKLGHVPPVKSPANDCPAASLSQVTRMYGGLAPLTKHIWGQERF